MGPFGASNEFRLCIGFNAEPATCRRSNVS